MKDKTTKMLIVSLVISVILMIAGYLLWTNLVAIPDVDSLSMVEVREAQQDLAINYPLGSFLMNIGFIGSTSTLLALVLKHIFSVVNKKKQ